MVWGDPDSPWFTKCRDEWQEGCFYKIRAAYREHERYGPQIELEKIRPVNDEDRTAGFDEADFIERSRHEGGAMLAELLTLTVKHIQDESLRQLVRLVLEAHGDSLQRLPAQRERAFPFVGGLLEHTLSVTRTAIDLGDRYAAAYPDLRPALNRDLIAAAAILHDVGRVAELDEESLPVGYTVPGRLLGHQVLGRDLVREAAQQVPDLNPDLLVLLEHVLLTSLHPSEGVGPRVALIPEALIVTTPTSWTCAWSSSPACCRATSRTALHRARRGARPIPPQGARRLILHLPQSAQTRAENSPAARREPEPFGHREGGGRDDRGTSGLRTTPGPGAGRG